MRMFLVTPVTSHFFPKLCTFYSNFFFIIISTLVVCIYEFLNRALQSCIYACTYES